MDHRDILAIEGEWQDNLRHTETIVLALKFMQEACGITFVHRRAPTRDAFLQYLDWGVQEKFRLLYLAGHGTKGELNLEAGFCHRIKLSGNPYFYHHDPTHRSQEFQKS
ncbi:MAG: hypothetical protein IT270_08060 [Saprospiraceae bacterium]|nr:hypothetical protein [Saprospiraceae bacterium]